VPPLRLTPLELEQTEVLQHGAHLSTGSRRYRAARVVRGNRLRLAVSRVKETRRTGHPSRPGTRPAPPLSPSPQSQSACEGSSPD
jgi:hypothetical protein